jgi:plastocyanin
MSIRTPRRRTVLAALLAAALALGVLAAQSLGASTVRLHAAATGALKFNVKVLRAAHGKVTVIMSNPSTSGLRHGIAVEGKGVDKDGKIVGPGKRSVLTLTLKKGTYQFHKAAGMKGKLIVS